MEAIVLTPGQHAVEWGIAPQHIGMMGFSAGGTVTLCTALQYDASSSPDFAAPIYTGSPPETPIPPDAPPLFLCCAADDAWSSHACIDQNTAWRAADHPAELAIYGKGGHGFGMRTLNLPSDRWIERFAEWLKAEGFLPPACGMRRKAREE